jgi:hypothetical protein
MQMVFIAIPILANVGIVAFFSYVTTGFKILLNTSNIKEGSPASLKIYEVLTLVITQCIQHFH